jgi:hypothetical protein
MKQRCFSPVGLCAKVREAVVIYKEEAGSSNLPKARQLAKALPY